MERFIEKVIPIWVVIHMGFISYQLLDTYMFNADTAGQSPNYEVSIFDIGRSDAEMQAAGTPQPDRLGSPVSLGTRLNREMARPPETVTEEVGKEQFTHAWNFILSFICKINDLVRVFDIIYSLFILDYPFMEKFDQEGEGVIRWVMQLIQYAGILAGIIFLAHLGIMFIRSGLIGTLISRNTVLFAGITTLVGAFGVASQILPCG